MSAPRFPHLPQDAWDLFLADALSDDAAGRLEAHLDACPACERALVAADPSFAFRKARGAKAPEGTWDGFWDELEPRLAPRRAPAPRRRVAMIGAVAAAAAIAAVFVVRRPPPDARVVSAPPDNPCPAATAQLHLTREECLALYGGPIEAPDPPVVVVSETVDLRGL